MYGPEDVDEKGLEEHYYVGNQDVGSHTLSDIVQDSSIKICSKEYF